MIVFATLQKLWMQALCLYRIPIRRSTIWSYTAQLCFNALADLDGRRPFLISVQFAISRAKCSTSLADRAFGASRLS
jgi:hypothetical protein